MRRYTQPLALVGVGCVAGLLLLNLTLLAPPGMAPGDRPAGVRHARAPGTAARTQNEARAPPLALAPRK